jgi:2-polyprenyl-3-methyl-5-hydroxy-6-metoxy-1,4-benzoquinol methylase
MRRRPKLRDARDYDTTQLRESGHGKTIGRDYSAHFFRWSFARRLIKKTDHVLEIGCGQDKPLAKVLTGSMQPYCAQYTGVDLNPVKTSTNPRLRFIGEFNFIKQWKQLAKFGPYDVLVSMEVVEHFHSRFMPTFMAACYALLKPGGILLLSTPCYDGKRMAANHINEMTVPQLRKYVVKAKFKEEARYGTFMDIRHIGKIPPAYTASKSVIDVWDALARYYDNDALSCFFAPLYPDHARNNLWVLKK